MKDLDRDSNLNEPSEKNEQIVSDGSSLEEHCSNVSKMSDSPSEELSALMTQFRYRSSPYPDPDELEKYENLVPGSAKKILDSFLSNSETEVAHRRQMDIEKINIQKKSLKLEDKRLNIGSEIVKTNSRRSLIGIWGGLILLFSSIVIGGYSVYKGYSNVAITIFSGTIGTLALNYAGNIFNPKSSAQLKQANKKNNQQLIENPEYSDFEKK
ncbi:MAG: hypothetical protein Tsb0014_09870 [Pleurocapsa sp.]